MPIKTLQPRLAEIGRLRMGRQVPTRNGKTRPERLAEWRLTSAQQGLLEYARDKYGGTITPWDGAPTEHVQYELFTDSPALDVLIPPGQIVSQWMETWSGGGCQRRCDGIHEYLSDQPCLCQHESPLPQEYRCKPQACPAGSSLRSCGSNSGPSNGPASPPSISPSPSWHRSPRSWSWSSPSSVPP